jgi:hypothetical protein
MLDNAEQNFCPIPLPLVDENMKLRGARDRNIPTEHGSPPFPLSMRHHQKCGRAGKRGHYGGEVVPSGTAFRGRAFRSSQKCFLRTARSCHGRAVVGRGEANPCQRGPPVHKSEFPPDGPQQRKLRTYANVGLLCVDEVARRRRWQPASCTPTAQVDISMAGRIVHRSGIAVRAYRRLSHWKPRDIQPARFRNRYRVGTASPPMAGFP